MSDPTDERQPAAQEYRPDEGLALGLDERDPLKRFRDRYHVPARPDGSPAAYFCGNSLGLQPKGVSRAVAQELDDWGRLAVDAHFDGAHPWYSYHEALREPAARLVGARPREVVMMNGLTVNLHLMLVSFYRPSPKRHKVLMEATAFPSDTYAVQSQLRFHGYDADEGVVLAEPRQGEDTLRTEDVEALLETRGAEIALVLLGGVNYYTGQAFDMQRIAAAARRQGCAVGLDLAHAAGNLLLALHDWDVDFAVWCSYKYLNSGPGAVAGCFVHERHAERADLPRLAGWWGNDPQRRFRMHLESQFVPHPGADGWQLSNPPILAMAPLRVALADFDEAGMPALRAKSKLLSEYLLYWIDRAGDRRIRVLTPRDPDGRGCQLSLHVREDARELFGALQAAGVIGDYREPDVIRVAPVPLYNTFHEVWRLGQALADWSRRG